MPLFLKTDLFPLTRFVTTALESFRAIQKVWKLVPRKANSNFFPPTHKGPAFIFKTLARRIASRIRDFKIFAEGINRHSRHSPPLKVLLDSFREIFDGFFFILWSFEALFSSRCDPSSRIANRLGFLRFPVAFDPLFEFGIIQSISNFLPKPHLF